MNEELELSGYYAFDTQWIRINRKWIYRLTLFDIINNIPVACLISEKETPKIIKNFIKTSIHPKDRKAIITDLKEDYNKIMKNLGFKHQHCTFHLIKNINTTLKPKITEELNKYGKEIRKNNPKISKTKINELIKNKKDKIKKRNKNIIKFIL